jgi:hypothetical protein
VYWNRSLRGGEFELMDTAALMQLLPFRRGHFVTGNNARNQHALED